MSDYLVKQETAPMQQGEVYTATQKLIIRLQAIRAAQNLTIPDVEKLVNHEVSRSTLYRFFEEGAESKYNFDTYTVDAVREALLVTNTMRSGDPVAQDKVAAYEMDLQRLRARMEDMQAAHERRCKEYEARLELWQRQVEKKDDRMDRKDRLLDQKDEEIRQLRARIDQLVDQLLEGNK